MVSFLRNAVNNTRVLAMKYIFGQKSIGQIVEFQRKFWHQRHYIQRKYLVDSYYLTLESIIQLSAVILPNIFWELGSQDPPLFPRL